MWILALIALGVVAAAAGAATGKKQKRAPGPAPKPPAPPLDVPPLDVPSEVLVLPEEVPEIPPELPPEPPPRPPPALPDPGVAARRAKLAVTIADLRKRIEAALSELQTGPAHVVLDMQAHRSWLYQRRSSLALAASELAAGRIPDLAGLAALLLQDRGEIEKIEERLAQEAALEEEQPITGLQEIGVHDALYAREGRNVIVRGIYTAKQAPGAPGPSPDPRAWTISGTDPTVTGGTPPMVSIYVTKAPRPLIPGKRQNLPVGARIEAVGVLRGSGPTRYLEAT